MIIPITKPSFDECEKESIVKPLVNGWVVQGPFVAEFEELFLEFVGTRYARAVTNCTTALHLALEVEGIRAGDKVIVPSFTFVASANAVEYTGAEVVFCDIDLATFNIEISAMEAILARDKERKIKAVIPVNLFGLCANLPEINRLAKKFGLKVIEDSACGLGAYIKGRHSGTFGDAGCFSFHPRKAITTGEGGMIITDRADIAEAVSSLRDHGACKSDYVRHSEKGGSLLPEFNLRGYNYRMTDMQGALGVCQMKKAKTILEKRKKIADAYDAALKETDKLCLPSAPEGYAHGYQSYVCLFTNGEDVSRLTTRQIGELNIKRNRAMAALEQKGIATRQGTHAIHTLGYYSKKYNLTVDSFRNSYVADRLSIALPLYADMSAAEFEYVISNLKEVIQ